MWILVKVLTLLAIEALFNFITVFQITLIRNCLTGTNFFIHRQLCDFIVDKQECELWKVPQYCK